MAKGKSSGRSAYTSDDAIALSAMLRPPVPSVPITPPIVMRDERFYTPLRLQQPLAAGGRPARLQTPSTGSFRRGRIQFQSATVVDTCVRRKTRREVIFAKGKSGKGSRAKFRRKTAFTGISCK